MKETITIQMSTEEIGELIKAHIKSRYPDSKGFTVAFDISSRIEGYGMGEHPVVKFDGANVTFSHNV